MNESVLSDLSKRHSLVRLSLLCSLVFFLIGLFAFVSHWSSAVPIVIFACLFRLVAVWLARKSYHAAWMKASVSAAGARRLKNAVYSARETASQTLVQDLGFGPDVLLTPNALRFHVLRGNLRGCPLEMSETAFVRVSGNRRTPGSRTVAGTLITAEGALPEAEAWVLLLNRPLDDLCTMREYDLSSWRSVSVPLSGAAAFAAGETACLEAAAKAMGTALPGRSAALAAAGGKLSLMLPGDFYARKPEISKAPTEAALNSADLPALDPMEKILARLRDGGKQPS